MKAHEQPWQDRYMKRFYPRERGWIDGTTEFHALIAEACGRGGRLLEIGAGPTNDTSRFLAGLGELHGLDPDPDVRSNEVLVTASVLSGETYPYEDGRFDHCVSNYVVEHVPDADSHLREIRRVLKPGGSYVFRTPNRFHYVAMVAALTPHWFHKLVANPLRNLPAGAHDPYPTVYAMNSEGAIRRAAERNGFEVERLRMVEKEPSYGMIARPLFLAFLLYERLVKSTEALANFRANFLVVLRKSGTGVAPNGLASPP
jgi:SAM-dependent methyltransferase